MADGLAELAVPDEPEVEPVGTLRVLWRADETAMCAEGDVVVCA